MRKELKQIEGQRIKIIAEIKKFSHKKAYKGPPKDTVCLINLEDDGNNFICDHLWLTVGKQMAKLNLKIGDKVSFYARATEYVKGYFGHRKDVFWAQERCILSTGN